ncbi:MAG: GGDEF domain-containing protein [Rubrivivax sp.]|nr:MAG: GGDEF domain-containing protein [Rubrivivax sp.]
MKTHSASSHIERQDVALAGTLIEAGLSWMRFPARLEQQFLQDGAAHRLRFFTISGLLSLIVFNGFLLVDYLLAPDVFWLAVKLRLGVFTPCAVFLLMLVWFARDWVLRHFSPLLVEGVVMLSGVCAAACLAYILSVSKNPSSQYYHVGLMIVVMYGNIVQRLRFWYALAFSLVVYAIHLAGVLMVPAINTQVVVPIMVLLAATVTFTLTANHAMERDERKRYLLSLRRKHLLADLSDVHERLQKVSRVDAMTGVYNRRHFQEYLSQAWQRAQHDGAEMAVIMIDVDHFKNYNDRYGHPAGDDCLVKVAKAMAPCLGRAGDLVARLGGEEFIVVLPNADASVAQRVAERIRQAIETLHIRHEDSGTASVVTASVGVACCRARAGQHEDTLTAAADAALYRAKQAGRNRVICQSF